VSTGFIYPWLLLAVPLALLPLWRRPFASAKYSWLGILPRDPLSDRLGWFLRVMTAIAIGATVVALAGPYRATSPVQRIGQGAEIVVLLDRSLSMDQSYAGAPSANWFEESAATKAKVARRLLARFAANRGHDRIGMVVFSTRPVRIIGPTPRQEVIQAAIQAGAIGRGLAETDVGSGLLAALAYFDNRPFAGARIVLLVSDGGSDIDFETGTRITKAMKRNGVTLYWLYLRSYGSPGLLPAENIATATAVEVPEQALERFFASMGTPYRAYEAENPQALEAAIDDVNRLANLPIRYSEVLPRQDRTRPLYALALLCALVLLAAKVLESEQWS
jgi:mxaC protein